MGDREFLLIHFLLVIEIECMIFYKLLSNAKYEVTHQRCANAVGEQKYGAQIADLALLDRLTLLKIGTVI